MSIKDVVAELRKQFAEAAAEQSEIRLDVVIWVADPNQAQGLKPGQLYGLINTEARNAMLTVPISA
jgi:hypothetical protein